MANPGYAIVRALSRATQGLRGDLPRRQKIEIIICGVGLTLLVVGAELAGMLGDLENFLYDRRATDCQFFTGPPTDRIHHLDIDDKAIETLGRWPWSRATMARMLEEVRLAGPKLVGIDVLYSEADEAPGADEELAAVIERLGNVALPVSLELSPPRSTSSFESAIVALLTADPELTPDQLRTRLRARGFTTADYGTTYEDLFLAARRRAVFERLRFELGQTPDVTLPELYARLIPRTDTTIGSPLLRLVGDEHAKLVGVREVARLGIAPPAGIAKPIPTAPKSLPLPSLTRVTAATGFAEFDVLPDPVVRELPLLVEYDGRLYPQFGISIALRMLGADPGQLRVDRNVARVPYPGGEVAVPVKSIKSEKLGRDVPLMFHVPYFGTTRWETMYDYPEYAATTAHSSLAFVWDVCLTREKIERNNAAVDTAVSVLLDNDKEYKFGQNPRRARAYAASRPVLQDTAAREQIVAETLATLSDPDNRALFDAVVKASDAELRDADERFRRDEWRDAERSLLRAQQENRGLQEQLGRLRAQLVGYVKDRAVLIGMTATGGQDTAATPLNPRCPGVVVHGIVANAVLTNHWWRVAPAWVAPVCTIVLGFVTSGVCGWFRPGQAAAAAGVLALGYLVGNGVVLFDYFDLLVPAGAPLVAVSSAWAGCTLLRLILEGFERIRVAKDLAIFRHEMELARSVQQALIPKDAPEIPGLEPHGWTKPADMTGGDCFDLWKLPDGRLGVFLADASGHGLAPSMIVSQVRALVRILCETEPEPDHVLARVNARVADDLEAGRFATAFLGFLAADGTLTYSSAGHGPVLWCSEAAGQMLELDSSGLPLGVMGEWLGAPQPTVTLAASGMLVVFSDGIFEAPCPTGEQFGVERVLAILKDKCGCNATSGEIVAAMREAVTKWQGQDTPADDQTTVIVRRIAVPAPVTHTPEKLAATGVPAPT